MRRWACWPLAGNTRISPAAPGQTLKLNEGSDPEEYVEARPVPGFCVGGPGEALARSCRRSVEEALGAGIIRGAGLEPVFMGVNDR